MALRGKRKVAVGTRAAVNVAGHLAALDRVGVTAIRRQFINAAHYQLPFLAVGLDTLAKQLVGNQMRHFVGHGLFQEMLGVFAVQLWIETQQVFVQMRDTGFLAPQLEADLRAFEASFEKGFGLQETIFDAGIEWLGHAVSISRAVQYAAKRSVFESVRRRMVIAQDLKAWRAHWNFSGLIGKMLRFCHTSPADPSAMGTLTVNQNKLQKRLRRLAGEAVADFNMIEDGDKVMVCLSGGKDSYTMLDVLLHLQKVAPIKFDIVAVNMDQKQPGFPEHVLPAYLKALGVEYHIVEKDTYSVVKALIPEGKTTCSLCSRLRRGTLYTFADEIGATKMALGHHRDDIVETFFLNMFFNGSLKAMPPKLRADDGRNVVIRPLAYCNEKDIQAYSDLKQFPIIPCNLCGSQENLQRQVVKEMLLDWERKTPGRTESIFRSLQNVIPSQLADRNLFDFNSLRIDESAASRFVNVVNL